jgi:hypothetical protein
MKAEEIKNELVKRGFKFSGDRVYYKNIGNYLFEYDIQVGSLDVFLIKKDPYFEHPLLTINYPTLERIEALIFGLTGERI